VADTTPVSFPRPINAIVLRQFHRDRRARQKESLLQADDIRRLASYRSYYEILTCGE